MLELTDPETICWDLCLVALHTQPSTELSLESLRLEESNLIRSFTHLPPVQPTSLSATSPGKAPRDGDPTTPMQPIPTTAPPMGPVSQDSSDNAHLHPEQYGMKINF